MDEEYPMPKQIANINEYLKKPLPLDYSSWTEDDRQRINNILFALSRAGYEAQYYDFTPIYDFMEELAKMKIVAKDAGGSKQLFGQFAKRMARKSRYSVVEIAQMMTVLFGEGQDWLEVQRNIKARLSP